jgi:hypothetical protein
VDPHAGDVAPVRIRSDGISIERGVARDEEVLLPKVQNFGEKAKRGARFGQVGVVVMPKLVFDFIILIKEMKENAAKGPRRAPGDVRERGDHRLLAVSGVSSGAAWKRRVVKKKR